MGLPGLSPAPLFIIGLLIRTGVIRSQSGKDYSRLPHSPLIKQKNYILFINLAILPGLSQVANWQVN